MLVLNCYIERCFYLGVPFADFLASARTSREGFPDKNQIRIFTCNEIKHQSRAVPRYRIPALCLSGKGFDADLKLLSRQFFLGSVTARWFLSGCKSYSGRVSRFCDEMESQICADTLLLRAVIHGGLILIVPQYQMIFWSLSFISVLVVVSNPMSCARRHFR